MTYKLKIEQHLWPKKRRRRRCQNDTADIYVNASYSIYVIKVP